MAPAADELTALEPAEVLEGGDLDCGSGLVLLLRDAMLGVPAGEVLELRSREPTVADDLPPWCRMAGHAFLGAAAGEGCRRYFVRRRGGGDDADDARALEADKARARSYEWRTRVRHSGTLESTAYCRSFQFDIGQPASFDEQDAHPCAVEYLLGALGGALAVGFATEAARAGLDVDDIELTVRGRLHDALAVVGLSDGDPGLARAEVKCFVTCYDDPERIRAAWDLTVARSPLVATLRKAAELETKLAIV